MAGLRGVAISFNNARGRYIVESNDKADKKQEKTQQDKTPRLKEKTQQDKTLRLKANRRVFVARKGTDKTGEIPG